MQAQIIKRQLRAKPVYNGVTMIDIRIAYPHVALRSDPQTGAVISTYYREAANRYYAYATHDLFRQAVQGYADARKNHFPFRTYAAVSNYEVPYNQNNFLSTYQDTYEFTGGAHGNTVRHSDTWLLVSGRRMQLSDFFYGPAYQMIILEDIIAQIAKSVADGSGSYFDDYRKNVFQYFDENNYYLAAEGFAFYFPLYSIAPYSSGIPTFVVPYSTFGKLLKVRL